jgi:hypothetical protein
MYLSLLLAQAKNNPHLYLPFLVVEVKNEFLNIQIKIILPSFH